MRFMVKGIILMLLVISQDGLSKEVKITKNGRILNAMLEVVSENGLKDGVILVLHGGLAHRDMSTIAYLRSLLRNQGYNLLSINLSLSIDDRRGMFDCKLIHRHKNEDAIEEIAAWVNWLKRRGVKEIALLGHSRGGAQVALYAHQKADIQSIILLAPATLENGFHSSKKIIPVLEEAKKYIQANQTEKILQANMMFCRDANVTAESFYSYYQNSMNLDSPSLIAQLNIPVLLVIASEDEIVIGLEKKVKPNKWLSVKIVQGAGHFFRDLFSDDAVDYINQFLRN